MTATTLNPVPQIVVHRVAREPRGLMVGKVFTGAKASDFCGLAGSGSTRANTRAAQKYNDGCSTYEGVQ